MDKNNNISKELSHSDDSGFEFVKELLGNNVTAAINFDRLQKHPDKGYIIFEYLLCEESQFVTPYTSHPKRYWQKNSTKFLSLWRATIDLNATLYLVNYAKKGTKHEDKVLLIHVLDMDYDGIKKQEVKEYTRKDFSEWFVKLNNECLSDDSEIISDIYMQKYKEELDNFIMDFGKYESKSLQDIYKINPNYLIWVCENVNNKFEQVAKIKAYLKLKNGVGINGTHK